MLAGSRIAFGTNNSYGMYRNRRVNTTRPSMHTSYEQDRGEYLD